MTSQLVISNGQSQSHPQHATVNNQAMVIKSLQDMITVGGILVKSGLFKNAKSEASAVAQIVAGHELGIPPVAALRGIQIIEGQITIGANLIAALIKKSGRYNYRVKISNNEECIITFYELFNKWEEVGESSFTLDDAQKAGLKGKQNWTKYPKAMLYCRAMSQGSRMFAPDIFAGAIYTADEMGAETDEDGNANSIIDAKVVHPIQKPLVDSFTPTPPTTKVQAVTPTPTGLTQSERVMQIRELVGCSKDWVVERLKSYGNGIKNPNQINEDQYRSLIEAMIADWCERENITDWNVIELRGYVQDLVRSRGYSEPDAIADWMQSQINGKVSANADMFFSSNEDEEYEAQDAYAPKKELSDQVEKKQNEPEEMNIDNLVF